MTRSASIVGATGIWASLGGGCWHQFTPGTCNDGVYNPEVEDCDNGADNQDPATAKPGECTWECTWAPGPRCGDKKTDDGEDCDDGIEGGEWCTKECRRIVGCGNKHQDPGEECDDPGGNQAVEDAMPGDCVEMLCKKANCGNGLQEGDEQCDDVNGNKSLAEAREGDCTDECKYAACGDGELNEDEDCDDGNFDDADGCPADCSCADRCGNSVTDHECGETCDRGPQGDKTCSKFCQEHRCGDGVMGPGEQCDGGAMVDPAICTAQCQSPTSPGACGNGTVDADEDCDDGNMVTTDGCVGCKKAFCGDGFVRTGTEECDDGKNDGSYGSCSVDCTEKGPHCGDKVVNMPEEQCEIDAPDCLNCWLPRVVFVTTTTKSGNLGGLMAADALCQSEWDSANANTLRKFNAWLSAGTTSAAKRLASTAFKGYYVLPDGTKVANGWAGLTTENLLVAITKHADGTSLETMNNGPWAWTNTTEMGEVFRGNEDCGGWTKNTKTGRAGKVAGTGPGWSSSTSSQCSPPSQNHLYCIQVQP
ncbi:hypothetical protein [Nannocystis sp.]|uniref:hypothetical protein n=1 Tax=Nannocystis sp. TaxID=1962667 RepID=UPI0025D07D7B|nr:hypothetical protein [Nannocystis sp.]MBK7827189.1 hypothetical protein [Nannocystis sp.]